MLAARMFPGNNLVARAVIHSNTYLSRTFFMMFSDMSRCTPIRYLPSFLQHYGMICAKVKDAEALERLGRLFWYNGGVLG